MVAPMISKEVDLMHLYGVQDPAKKAMFSLIKTSKVNEVESYAYLQYVIGHIAAADTDEALDTLMPRNMK